MIGQIFALLCEKIIAFQEIWGPTFEEQVLCTVWLRRCVIIGQYLMLLCEEVMIHSIWPGPRHRKARKLRSHKVCLNTVDRSHGRQAFMWNLGPTIIIMKGLVKKTKLHACYKNRILSWTWFGSLKFERVKCQAWKSSRSAHKPWPRWKAYFQIWKRFMVGWQRKNLYGLPGQNFM